MFDLICIRCFKLDRSTGHFYSINDTYIMAVTVNKQTTKWTFLTQTEFIIIFSFWKKKTEINFKLGFFKLSLQKIIYIHRYESNNKVFFFFNSIKQNFLHFYFLFWRSPGLHGYPPWHPGPDSDQITIGQCCQLNEFLNRNLQFISEFCC